MLKKQIPFAEDFSLHLPTMEDAQDFYNVVEEQRIYLEDWMTWLHSIHSLEDAKRYLFDAMRFNEGGQRLMYFIKKDNELAGSVAFIKVDKAHQKGELGYWLCHNFIGQGIAKRAVKALIQIGFEDKQLHRIEIVTSEHNQASRLLAERLGFEQEGILKENFFHQNKYHNTVIYGLLEQIWRKKKIQNNKL